jgi:hypothetical protein
MQKGSKFHTIRSDPSIFAAMKRILFVFVGLILTACGCPTCNSEECERILFIGNSFLYENEGVDGHLRNLICGTEGLEGDIQSAAEGKYHLMTHWKNSETQSIFSSQKWDKIVLQEYVLGPLKKNAEFEKYATKWADQMKKSNPNAEIILFSPWRYKSAKGMEGRLFQKYSDAAKKIHAEVVPVGFLWEDVRSKVDLYDQDGAHPNRKGTFLTACLFYEQLFNRDVRKTQNNDSTLSKSTQKKLKEWAHSFNENRQG